MCIKHTNCIRSTKLSYQTLNLLLIFNCVYNTYYAIGYLLILPASTYLVVDKNNCIVNMPTESPMPHSVHITLYIYKSHCRWVIWSTLIVYICIVYLWYNALCYNKVCNPTHGPAMPCAEQFIWYKHNCYYYSNDRLTWENSKYKCETLKSSLLIISSVSEYNFAAQFLKTTPHWIGLSRHPNETNNTWLNGVISSWNITSYEAEWAGTLCAYMFYDYLYESPCDYETLYICKTSAGERT